MKAEEKAFVDYSVAEKYAELKRAKVDDNDNNVFLMLHKCTLNELKEIADMLNLEIFEIFENAPKSYWIERIHIELKTLEQMRITERLIREMALNDPEMNGVRQFFHSIREFPYTLRRLAISYGLLKKNQRSCAWEELKMLMNYFTQENN